MARAPTELPRPRPGTKDRLLIPHFHLLGALSDAEVARRAGVSGPTVSRFREHHGIRDPWDRGASALAPVSWRIRFRCSRPPCVIEAPDLVHAARAAASLGLVLEIERQPS